MKECKYLELLKKGDLEKLKDLLESEIQKQGALKTNSKTRFSAIKRIQKTNEKSGKVNLLGYGLKDSKYYFTDSYHYALLNDGLGYNKNDKFPTDGLYNIDDRANCEREKLYISIEDLSYYVKTKENYKNEYFGDVISFNYNYIKNAIDILGNKDIEIYSSKDKQMLIFENNDNERVSILACKVY